MVTFKNRIAINNFYLPKLITLIIALVTIITTFLLCTSALPYQLLQPPGSDDVSIIVTLGILVGKFGYIPLLDFYQEYAPGFHYVIALMLKLFGYDTPGMLIGFSVIHLIIAPLLLAILAVLTFKRTIWTILTVAFYFCTLPWVGVKGLALLTSLVVMLYGEKQKSLYYIKSGISIGLLMLFAQEFSIYLGYAFLLYTSLDLFETNILLQTRYKRFFLNGALSSLGFTMATLPVVIFYYNNDSLSNLILYMFKIGLGVQAKMMALPFCFDCNDYISKMYYYLTPFIPIVSCITLYFLPERHNHTWKTVSFLSLLSSTILITALGRSTIGNISLGGILNPLLIIFIVSNAKHLRMRQDIFVILMIISATILQIVIIRDSETFGRLQLLIVIILTAILASKIYSQSNHRKHFQWPSFLIDFTIFCRIKQCSGDILLRLIAISFVISYSIFPLIRIANSFKDFIKIDLVKTIDYAQSFKEKRSSWMQQSMLTNDAIASELIDYVSNIPAKEIFVFPRPATLYLASGKMNATKNYFFARYFSYIADSERLIQILEEKQLKYIIVEESLAATGARSIYWYILENYIQEKQIGQYAIYKRSPVKLNRVVLTKIVDAFEPQTNAKEYIWANYLKKSEIPPSEKVMPQYNEFLFQHPPHAECIDWNYMSWIENYKQLEITWLSNPRTTSGGNILFLVREKKNWKTISEKYLNGGGKVNSFIVNDLQKKQWLEMRFCSDLPSGSYLKIVARR